MPDAPVFADGIARTEELAERGDGEVTVLAASGRNESDAARLEALFTAERSEEWAEFIPTAPISTPKSTKRFESPSSRSLSSKKKNTA